MTFNIKHAVSYNETVVSVSFEEDWKLVVFCRSWVIVSKVYIRFTGTD